MPQQIRLFQGIDCAIRAARPNDELDGAYLRRVLAAAEVGSLPPRIGDWFEAELQQPVVHPGWPRLFEDALKIIRAVELTGEDVQSLFHVGERIEQSASRVAEIASVCTIIALEHRSQEILRDRILKAKADRRRDRQAILGLQKRLPNYILEAEFLVDPCEDRLRKLLDALNEWPGFPQLPSPRLNDWHRFAAEIADAYEGESGREISVLIDASRKAGCSLVYEIEDTLTELGIIRPAGWSKAGPAVSFVVKAIKRVLQRTVTPDAVEKAIFRTRTIKRSREAAEFAAAAALWKAWEERKIKEDPDYFRRIS